MFGTWGPAAVYWFPETLETTHMKTVVKILNVFLSKYTVIRRDDNATKTF